MMKLKILCLLILWNLPVFGQKKKIPAIGVVQDIKNDSLLNTFGFTCLVESVSVLLSPRTVTEEQFQANLKTIKNLKVPLYACNLFIPGDLKVVGPKVDEKAVLAYVDVVLRRAKAAGLRLITWGSGGSRGVPPGFDQAEAKKQFIYMAKKIAMVASKYDILLALENLNSTECNFLNKLGEALEVVKAVDHKNFRLCIDIYHMLKENELPTVIEGTKKYAIYCEIAEKEGRTPPGVNGEDLRPYLRALKKEGYKGKIVMECRWQNLALQGSMAYQNLRQQVDEAYK
ncbi:MAG: sugar phosphate isomerase/epimerase family protein [Saprospiraceae bacterium]|nr:sugar phosphate isomerase/epimerase family protein [Saprospiraceae bacterium]